MMARKGSRELYTCSRSAVGVAHRSAVELRPEFKMGRGVGLITCRCSSGSGDFRNSVLCGKRSLLLTRGRGYAPSLRNAGENGVDDHTVMLGISQFSLKGKTELTLLAIQIVTDPDMTTSGATQYSSLTSPATTPRKLAATLRNTGAKTKPTNTTSKFNHQEVSNHNGSHN